MVRYDSHTDSHDHDAYDRDTGMSMIAILTVMTMMLMMGFGWRMVGSEVPSGARRAGVGFRAAAARLRAPITSMSSYKGSFQELDFLFWVDRTMQSCKAAELTSLGLGAFWLGLWGLGVLPNGTAQAKAARFSPP